MLPSKTTTSFKAIAAMSLNHAIGCEQKLPWHIPEELKWFKQVTLNQTLVMGRKTFESMGCRPLPQRKTYVLTRSNVDFQGVEVIHSPEELYHLDGTVWVCGGAQIYEQFLPICDELVLSVIPRWVHGDAFFPHFEPYFKFNIILKQTILFEVQSWIRK